MTIRIHRGPDAKELLAKLGLQTSERAKPRDLEGPEQVTLIQWVRTQFRKLPDLGLLYAVPNGGQRNYQVAKKLRAQGVIAGVPDLALPVARRGYHSLYIEMKYGDNTLTGPQKRFSALLMGRNNCFAVCYSADEAIEVLEWYLGLTETVPATVKNPRN